MIAGLWNVIVDSLNLIVSYVMSPNKRLFVGYLLSSLLIAFWIFRRTEVGGSFWKYIFPRRIWASPSAWVDYKLLIFNSAFKVLLLSHFVVYGLHLAFWVNEYLSDYFGAVELSVSQPTIVVGYTLTLTIFGDFTVYLVHRLMHHIPALWSFHSVHHSATVLNPLTQLRIHPFELVLNNLRGLLVFGLLSGLFHYLSGQRVTPLALMGVNIFSFAFFSAGASLRHSHVKLRYWYFLEHLLISPYQHQIHHSRDPAHHGYNFGSKLALWDWLFGTLLTSNQPGKLEFGLPVAESHEQTLSAALRQPFTRTSETLVPFSKSQVDDVSTTLSISS